MACFLEILRCILCCEDNRTDCQDYQVLNPSASQTAATEGRNWIERPNLDSSLFSSPPSIAHGISVDPHSLRRISIYSRINRSTEQKEDPKPSSIYASSARKSQQNPPEVSRTNVIQVSVDRVSSVSEKNLVAKQSKISVHPRITDPNDKKKDQIPAKITSISTPAVSHRENVIQASFAHISSVCVKKSVVEQSKVSDDSKITKKNEQKIDQFPATISLNSPSGVSLRTDVLQAFVDHVSSAHRKTLLVEQSKASCLPSSLSSKISVEPRITKNNEYQIPAKISSISPPEASEKNTVHQTSIESVSSSFQKVRLVKRPEVIQPKNDQILAKASTTLPEAPQITTIHQTSVDAHSLPSEKRWVIKPPKAVHQKNDQIPSKISSISPPETPHSISQQTSADSVSSSSEEPWVEERITKMNEHLIQAKISSISPPEASEKTTVNKTSIESVSSFQKRWVVKQPEVIQPKNDKILAKVSSFALPEGPQIKTVHQTSVDTFSLSSEKRWVGKQPKVVHQKNDQIPSKISSISSTETQTICQQTSFDSGSSSSEEPWVNKEPWLEEEPWVEEQKVDRKNKLPVFAIPEDLKNLIKMDVVPKVLTKPLTAISYYEYFATLLYAEDYYCEKWNGFLLPEVTLQLQEEPSNENLVSRKSKDRPENIFEQKKVYVVFEIDSIPERRPFLLSRDFVFIRPSGKKVEPFQGSLFRVVNKGTLVLTEFGDDFHSHYSPRCKYDVSFSFNRVCLKRAHHAIAAALNPPFQDFLFPPLNARASCSVLTPKMPYLEQISAISQILSLKGPPPYLVEGPCSVDRFQNISKTGVVLIEAIVQICRASPKNRVLVAAPKNRTCDVLMQSLQQKISESELFRANAAFRGLEDVLDDILPSCSYEGECFTCPPLCELLKYRVITSTYISSFRLRAAGINAGHFSHIFLVDASSAIEPDVMVALTNLAVENTAIVVTGSLRDRPNRVRSDIARRNGLMVSYFQRLLNRRPYSDRDALFEEHLR